MRDKKLLQRLSYTISQDMTDEVACARMRLCALQSKSPFRLGELVESSKIRKGENIVQKEKDSFKREEGTDVDTNVPHIIRIYRADGTFATQSVPLLTTASEIVQIMGKKSYVYGELDTCQLFMATETGIRTVRDDESPIVEQRDLLRKAGYQEDRIAGDVRHICRFTIMADKEYEDGRGFRPHKEPMRPRKRTREEDDSDDDPKRTKRHAGRTALKSDLGWRDKTLQIFERYTRETRYSYFERGAHTVTWYYHNVVEPDPDINNRQARSCLRELQAITEEWDVDIIQTKTFLEVGRYGREVNELSTTFISNDENVRQIPGANSSPS